MMRYQEWLGFIIKNRNWHIDLLPPSPIAPAPQYNSREIHQKLSQYFCQNYILSFIVILEIFIVLF